MEPRRGIHTCRLQPAHTGFENSRNYLFHFIILMLPKNFKQDILQNANQKGCVEIHQLSSCESTEQLQTGACPLRGRGSGQQKR